MRVRGDNTLVLMLDPDLPVPLWQQLVADLRARIDSGELTVRVPSIKTLAQEYETSHRRRILDGVFLGKDSAERVADDVQRLYAERQSYRVRIARHVL